MQPDDVDRLHMMIREQEAASPGQRSNERELKTEMREKATDQDLDQLGLTISKVKQSERVSPAQSKLSRHLGSHPHSRMRNQSTNHSP